jgi:hypothetical protein
MVELSVNVELHSGDILSLLAGLMKLRSQLQLLNFDRKKIKELAVAL